MYDSVLKGDIVQGPPAVHPDSKGDFVLNGIHNVKLLPLTLDHAPGLFKNIGGTHNNHIYTWLPSEGFPDIESFTEHMNFLVTSPMFFPFTIFLTEPNDSGNSIKLQDPVGITCLMNISPSNRSVEIGHVVFGPKLARTIAATEVNYLLMKFAFEDLHFQRVEWKTNDFNEASKRAALRLGFTYEGLFRKHMVVKGRRRDSWWGSCLDDEWFKVGKGGVREALEKWLKPENFDGKGKQKKKLEEIREDEA